MPSLPAARVDSQGVVHGAAEVLCDTKAKVGSFSYLIPREVVVHLGDAVHVPFGKQELDGVVVGPGDVKKATRPLLTVHGTRVRPVDLQFARKVAERYFASFTQVAARLAPRSGKGHAPLEAGALTLTPYFVEGSLMPQRILPDLDPSFTRRYLLRAPLVDTARLAAEEAARLAERGQVLVLCPSVESVERVLSCFTAGAARLDAKALPGAWRSFAEGDLTVGIGTRTAALYSAASLAGIVVVDEDHPGHNEATAPYTNSRDLSTARSKFLKIPLTLIGSNPTPASLGAGVKVFPVGTSDDWPTMRVVDREDFAPADRPFPPPLIAALTRAERAGQLPVVLAARKKAARRCKRCGIERPCTECSSSTCKHLETTPCPRCKSTEVQMVGWDADRLVEVLRGRARPVTLGELQDERDVGLVVLYDMDTALSMPDLYPDAIGAHILITAAEAAGAGGTVVILTKNPHHPLLVSLCGKKDQMEVAKRAYALAKEENLPPFGRLLTVRSGQDSPPSTTGWPGTIYGPRRNGKEWEILVKVSESQLEKLRPLVERLQRGGKVRVTLS